MPSSGMLRGMALRTDVSEECSSSIIKVKRIGDPGTLAVTTMYRFLRSVHQCLVTAKLFLANRFSSP
jgi:hypothetical protein